MQLSDGCLLKTAIINTLTNVKENENKTKGRYKKVANRASRNEQFLK